MNPLGANSHLIAFCLAATGLLALPVQAHFDDCSHLLQGALVNQTLHTGATSTVASIVTPEGKAAVAKFYFRNSSALRLFQMNAGAFYRGLTAQRVLSHAELAPRSFGWTADPTAIHPLLWQLPLEIREQGVALVTVSEEVQNPVVEINGDSDGAQVHARLQHLDQDSLLRQVEEAERILRRLDITTSDDQALITASGQAARLWLIDFDLYGSGTSTTLYQVRGALPR